MTSITKRRRRGTQTTWALPSSGVWETICIWSAGQVQGLIHDIPTCAELVSRIMRDAEAIIQSRLDGMMSGPRREAAE